MQRVLVTGGAGQLGSDLADAFGDAAQVVRRSHAELDITDGDALDAAFAELAPDVVINCAAFHNVDECEREQRQAWIVNVEAVRALAERSAAASAKLVHFSTNYVFDGRRPEPYGEDDLPAPRSIYAITKLAGEHAALAYCPGALVIRGSGLYGRAGNRSKGGNFAQRMLARAREGGAVRMVSDQRLTPTYTPDLAAATAEAIDRDASGVLHLTNAGACSWYEFTLRILEIAGVDVPVEPVATSLPPGVADRPLNGVLVSRRAAAAGVAPLRPWEEALRAYLHDAGMAA